MRWLAWLLFLPLCVQAEEALVAVASNFRAVLEILRDDFESSSDHSIGISSGSTGVLYAQIVNGAPYDLLLAADQRRPILLEQQDAGIAGTRFTYGNGRLALWSRRPDLLHGTLADIFRSDRLQRLAIANPELAPYGRASAEVLAALEVAVSVEDKLVYGENVSQAFSMAAIGSADASFVSLSQLRLKPDGVDGRFIEIPPELHAPIRQDAILLRHGAGNPAARAFLEFLQSDAVRAKIAAYGY